MEILNNIWIALITPNEGLTNLIVLLMTFPESFLTMYLFLIIIKIKSTRKQRLTYMFSISLISIFNINIIPNPFNVFVNYIMMIILIYLIFSTTVLKSIIATLCPIAICGLIGSLFTNPYLSLLQISSEQIITVPIYRIGYLIMLHLFLILVIITFKYHHFNINIFEDVDIKTKVSIISNVVFGLISLITQAIIISYYIDILPLWITFLSFISLLAYFGISIYSLSRVMKLTLTTRKLESAESYNNTLRILHDNVRGFKHDFDNIVTTIGGYIKTEDIEGLKKYYLELVDDCEKVNNLYVLNPEIVNNDGIYNLLTKKYNESTSKDIKVNISFLLDLGNIHMKTYEFARILGILLDNAIEASSECEEKIINLNFRNDNKNSRELIVIENTYNDKNIDTEKIFEKGISSKENHTGLGLWEIRKIVKKNNNVNLYTSKNDKFFSQTLEIYY
ncbi:MAG: GHKL domain-containing protein [Clostridia bacterium]|nr:GHKL domain-containing protein [Clostridia bacterium]